MRPVGFVPIPFVNQFIAGDGDEKRFEPSAEVEKGASAMLDHIGSHLTGAS